MGWEIFGTKPTNQTRPILKGLYQPSSKVEVHSNWNNEKCIIEIQKYYKYNFPKAYIPFNEDKI